MLQEYEEQMHRLTATVWAASGLSCTDGALVPLVEDTAEAEAMQLCKVRGLHGLLAWHRGGKGF